MKPKFPGFKKCMAMMRKSNPQTLENGFHWLQARAREHVRDLIEAFGEEDDLSVRCCLLELIGSAKSPDAFDFLAGQLRTTDQPLRRWAIWGLKNLGTKESRTLLWQARSYTFETPEETEAFRSDLYAVMNIQQW